MHKVSVPSQSWRVKKIFRWIITNIMEILIPGKFSHEEEKIVGMIFVTAGLFRNKNIGVVDELVNSCGLDFVALCDGSPVGDYSHRNAAIFQIAENAGEV